MRAAREPDARREIAWLCGQALAWDVLVDECGGVLRRVIPHERFCFHSIDPATLLVTGGLARNLDRGDGYPRMVHNEYEEDDVNKWSWLAGRDRHAGSLSVATDGRRERSIRYREMLQPNQLAWELRASFVAGSRCWGAAGIYRSDGEPDFDETELDFLASVSGLLGEGFRRSLVAEATVTAAAATADADADDGAPGVILLGERNEPLEISPAARRWLAELRRAEGPGEEWLPVEVYSVAARARRSQDPPAEARARVRAPSGRWLTLDGVPLGGTARTAVVVQPARPRDIAPLILDSYGLTPRERAIAGHTLRGLSTSEIAAAEHLSPYTVQDHLKAIFDKAGVRSRRELVARVFYGHHLPRIAAGERPGIDGGFSSATAGATPLTRL